MPLGPDKARCGAQRTDQPAGVLCRMQAGYRTDHLGVGRCYRHGGNTPTHVQAAQVEMARQECDRLGLEVEIDPGDALIHAVWESAGNVEFYRSLVAQLSPHPDDDEFTLDEEGQPHYKRGEPGIYGRTYHVSGIPTGEAKPHILVTLYNDERDRLADVCVAALRAGVEERRVRMAERDATALLRAQVDTLKKMGLGDRLEEFRHEFVAALRSAAPVAASLGAPGTS